MTPTPTRAYLRGMLLLFLAAASPLSACAAAVHAMDASAIVAACPPPQRRNIWTGDYSPACDDALAYGRGLAQEGALPPVMARGLVAEFDRRAAACLQPKPVRALPPKDCASVTRIWC